MERVTIITGGAGGMGLATAKILGQYSHIVLSDVREERLSEAVTTLAEAGITSTSFVGDVTEEFLENTEEGASLVNVASMAGHLMPKLLVPTKVYANALTDKEKFLKKMLRRVNLMPKAQRAGMSYSVSKRFVIWYAKEMAKAFGARKKRIVSVSPGTFDTEMGQLEEKSGAYKLAELSALGRVGNVTEIAEVLAFCASDKASYLTGVDILCDGGTVSSVPLKELSKIQ